MIKIRPLRARWFSPKYTHDNVHKDYSQLTFAIYILWYNDMITLGERNKDIDTLNRIYREYVDEKVGDGT